MKNVLDFPPDKSKRLPLNIKDVDTIAFLTVDDRKLYISDRNAIIKIMRLIVQDKIAIIEEKT